MISTRSLNKNEKKLFDKDPAKGRQTLKYAVKAMFEERVRYQNNGEDGTDSNAFLHVYWSALLSKNISEDWALNWTNAHEDDLESIHTKMDFFNNELGLNFVKENLNLDNEELANAIEILIDDGKARKVKNEELINSSKENKRNLNIFESIIEKAISLISKLIASSASLRNGEGMTPLIFASNQDEVEALKIIIKYSDLEAVDQFGETALFHATRLKTSDVGLLLLSNKANANANNVKDGNTPLMEAVVYKNISLANMLIQHGANISAIDKNGFSAYDLAVNEGVGNDFSFLKPI